MGGTHASGSRRPCAIAPEQEHEAGRPRVAGYRWSSGRNQGIDDGGRRNVR
jgi:hypothetical protein